VADAVVSSRDRAQLVVVEHRGRGALVFADEEACAARALGRDAHVIARRRVRVAQKNREVPALGIARLAVGLDRDLRDERHRAAAQRTVRPDLRADVVRDAADLIAARRRPLAPDHRIEPEPRGDHHVVVAEHRAQVRLRGIQRRGRGRWLPAEQAIEEPHVRVMVRSRSPPWRAERMADLVGEPSNDWRGSVGCVAKYTRTARGRRSRRRPRQLARQHGASGPPPTTTSAASPAAPGPRIAQPPAAPGSLSGKVTRRDGGAPIAGAVIAIAAKPMGPRTGPAPDAPSAVVVTDASGAWSAPAIAAGSYKVTASAVGFLPASTSPLAVAAGEHKDRVDLALASGGTTVSGTVSDIGGGVIAGARVTMRAISSRARGATDKVIALSGDDGRYQLTLAAGDCAAEVAHDDYTRGRKWFRVTATPLVVDFVLAPGATVRGQVVASDGTPVAGAEVISRAERR